ncbi:MAG: peptidoglycan DD-metalloendopeptidase family protein [Bacteroidales bacterium]
MKVSFKQRFLRFLGYVSVAVVFFFIAMSITFRFFDSPTEKKLRRDLEKSERQYKNLSKRVDKLNTVLEDIQVRDENLYRMIFEAEPAKRTETVYGNYTEFADVSSAELIIQTSSKIDELATALYIQSKSFDKIYTLAKTKNEMLICMPAILPVNKNETSLSSGFGYRDHPIFRDLRMHTGIDFAGPKGTPVYATGNGVVKMAGSNYSSMRGYGTVCEIDHGFGYQTLYAHLSKVNVREGQKIKRGDIIGYIGSTGNSTSSHLHYEVFLNGKFVDPVYYFFNDLSPEEYEKILEKSKEINQSLS